METKRISELTEAPVAGADDIIPIVSGGSTLKIKAENLLKTGKGVYTFTGLVVPIDSSATFDLTGFVNAAWCWRMEIEETGGSVAGLYDVEIHATNAFDGTKDNGRLMYQADGVDPTADGRKFIDQGGFQYEDGDEAKKLHLKFTNSDTLNQATYSVTIKI